VTILLPINLRFCLANGRSGRVFFIPVDYFADVAYYGIAGHSAACTTVLTDFALARIVKWRKMK
jgi:hypothetical protein